MKESAATLATLLKGAEHRPSDPVMKTPGCTTEACPECTLPESDLISSQFYKLLMESHQLGKVIKLKHKLRGDISLLKYSIV